MPSVILLSTSDTLFYFAYTFHSSIILKDAFDKVCCTYLDHV